MTNFAFPVIDSYECIGNSLSTINSSFKNASTFLSGLETQVYSVSAHTYTTVQGLSAGSNITIVPGSTNGIFVINANIDDENSTHSQFITGATNVGFSNAFGLYKQTRNQSLEFKKIISGGSNVIIQDDGSNIKISAFDRNLSPGGETNTASDGSALGAGLVMPKVGTNLPFKTLIAGSNITLTNSPSSITITSASANGVNVGNGYQLIQSAMNVRTLSGATPNVFVQYGGTNQAELRIGVKELTTGENLGTTTAGVFSIFKKKTGDLMGFKTLKGDSQTTNTLNTLSPCSVVLSEDSLGNTISIKVSDNVVGSNLGTGRYQIYKDKIKNALNFKTLQAGANVSITESNNTLTIDARGLAGGEINTATNVGLGAPLYKTKTGFQLEFKTLQAGPGIVIGSTTDTVVISAVPTSGTGLGDIRNAENIGSTGAGIFASKSGTVLNFKRLTSVNNNLAITEYSDSVSFKIQNVVSTAYNNPASEGARIFDRLDGDALLFRRLKAGTGISIYEGGSDNSEIIISSTSSSGGQQTPSDISNINLPPTHGFKNKLINGNFDLWQWQKRVSLNIAGAPIYSNAYVLEDSNNSTSLKFLADRFGFYAGRASTGGSGTQTAQFSCVQLTQTEIASLPSKPSRCGRIILKQRASGNTIPTRVFQRIENVSALAGIPLCLSFWARSNNVGSSQLELGYGQYYSPTVLATTNGYQALTTFSLTTEWQKLSASFTLPAINQTLWNTAWQTNAENSTWNSFTQMGFTIPGSTERYVDLVGMQLEDGSFSTNFETRPYSVELSLAERYFETGDSLQSQISVSTFTNLTDNIFKTRKRTAPTMLMGGMSVALSGISSSGVSRHEWFDTRDTGFRTKYQAYSNLSVASPHLYNWAASAEF